MIKAILFDFDGVLTIDKTGSESIIHFIVSKTGIPIETFETCYYRYNKGLLLGAFTHKDIWDALCHDLNFDIDYHLLTEAFENTVLDNDMIELVKTLHGKYKTAMVTDNKRDRIDVVSECNKFDQIFDVISVSADFHSGKENRTIFERTTAALGVSPSECIFIDNTPQNLVVPRSMGMTTILFDDENRNLDQFRTVLFDYLT